MEGDKDDNEQVDNPALNMMTIITNIADEVFDARIAALTAIE